MHFFEIDLNNPDTPHRMSLDALIKTLQEAKTKNETKVTQAIEENCSAWGAAAIWLKQDRKISRKIWNNSNIYVYLATGHDKNLLDAELRVNTINGFDVPWTPKTYELLATDWYVVNAR